MSQYLVLGQICVQNANAIAGLTWGFPAVTGFLGFTHALSLELAKQFGDQIELTGCAIVSNKTHNKVYQPKKFADYEFLQSKNPPVLAKHKGGSPPIIEEGKMNLTVSLVIEIAKPLVMTADKIKQLEKYVYECCCGMRLAGGTILDIKTVKLLSASTEQEQQTMLRKIKRLTMPGFVLVDRSNYLQQHYQNLKTQDTSTKLFDAWLDFSAMKFKATPQLAKNQTEADEKTPATWEYEPKPQKGWLVPLMTGYKAISERYKPKTVLNVRDAESPACFVEAIHSVGEWKGAHSIQSIDAVIWRYEYDGQWYLCKQAGGESPQKDTAQSDYLTEFNNLTETDVLNLL